jgi:2-methylcitrate dehydratase PrpD
VSHAAQALAEHVVGLPWEAVAGEVAQATKRSILDTLGVTIAASTQGEGYTPLIDLLRESGGRHESTILGFGIRTPAQAAAMANGAMARALMFDDYHIHKVHPSSTTVTAALALAERMGDVSGRDYVRAVAIGNDLTCRMALSIPLSVSKGSGWLVTDVFGLYGATAACAAVAGLDAEQTLSAFGIALCHGAATREGYSGHSSDGRSVMMQAMSTGFQAEAAVTSVLMAQRGITGPTDPFEGKTGLYPVYFRGSYDPSVLLDGLGSTLLNTNIATKRSPGTWHAMIYVDAVIALMQEHLLAPSDVEEIRVLVTEEGLRPFEPLAVKGRPASSQDANHSVPYLIGVGAAKGAVSIDDMSSTGYTDPRVLDMVDKIVPRLHEPFEAAGEVGPGESGLARVELVVRDGSTYGADVSYPYGHARNPMSWDDTVAKFRDCVTYSATSIADVAAEEVVRTVSEFETVADIRTVTALLS